MQEVKNTHTVIKIYDKNDCFSFIVEDIKSMQEQGFIISEQRTIGNDEELQIIYEKEKEIVKDLIMLIQAESGTIGEVMCNSNINVIVVDNDTECREEQELIDDSTQYRKMLKDYDTNEFKNIGYDYLFGNIDDTLLSLETE